jgi:regulator of replication initiation timing
VSESAIFDADGMLIPPETLEQFLAIADYDGQGGDLGEGLRKRVREVIRENAALRAQVEELTRERDEAFIYATERKIVAERAEAKLARVVGALEQIAKLTPDVAQDKVHVVAIKRIAEAALAAARKSEEGCLCEFGWRHCPIHQDDGREESEEGR